MKNLPLLSFACFVLIAGCGVNATTAPESSPAPLSRNHSPVPADFAAWRAGFRQRALANGIRSDVFDRAFAGVGVNARVIELDGRQAEFTKPIWDYLDTATSDARVIKGREMRAGLSQVLTAIENRYGVDGRVVLAIWGMETNFGSVRGDIPVIESLATLAYEGRRRSFAEEQLIAALRILQAGDVTPELMRGSWAGAMGHTQFIPTSYLQYAVDFTGDGRRDVWSDVPTDALASAANYLARAGWQTGAPWGIEVRLPAGFNFASADQSNKRPVQDWRARGVKTISGGILPDYGDAAIIAPAGAKGPAFAVFRNFFVIKRYNNATSYAMGVGHLGDLIGGGTRFAQSWPRSERPLSRSEKVEMQERLTALGFNTNGADGLVGPDTIAAIRAFQSSRGLVPDGFASAKLLDMLR